MDPFYLAWKAREYDMPTQFIELAGEVNQRMPYVCVARIAEALNDHAKPVKGSHIAIFGVSDKQGARLSYHDEHVPELPDLSLRSEWPHEPDCAVIVTAHPELDVERVVRDVPLVVDFRGVTREVEAEHLVRL